MRFASPDVPLRDGYIEVAPGVSVQFSPTAEPWIMWDHVDGPLLHLRDNTLHWLTLWERFQCWAGFADAYTLEYKHAPDFVYLWECKKLAHDIVERAVSTQREADNG